MHKLVCIVGPTAVGKTALALKSAHKFSGSLINADSRQVYKKLDIISGKDIPQNTKFQRFKGSEFQSLYSKYSFGYYNIQNIPLYLIDVVEPTYEFSVSDFVTIAPPVIDYISQQSKLPVLVGGTGFYIKALLDGIDTVLIPPNEELRVRLERKSVEELQNVLAQLNPIKLEKMNDSDKQNPRRLIRAIEILTHKKGSTWILNQKIASIQVRPLSYHEILMIGLTASRETIQSRIDLRVSSRLEHGALKEAETLFKQFDSLSNNVKTSSGYQQLFEYLTGETGLDEAIEKWKKAEYLIAKKQMTWFKKDQRVEWFDIEQKGFESVILDRISHFLASN